MEEAICSRVKPRQLKGDHHSNIFCLALNSGNTKVFSGGNDEQVILKFVESSETLPQPPDPSSPSLCRVNWRRLL
jgi:WD repeat-containing protein 22